MEIVRTSAAITEPDPENEVYFGRFVASHLARLKGVVDRPHKRPHLWPYLRLIPDGLRPRDDADYGIARFDILGNRAVVAAFQVLGLRDQRDPRILPALRVAAPCGDLRVHWSRMNHRQGAPLACQFAFENHSLGDPAESNWPAQFEWYCQRLRELDAVFRPVLISCKRKPSR